MSGDILMVDELKEIPQRCAGQNLDLMLTLLGGTSMHDVVGACTDSDGDHRRQSGPQIRATHQARFDNSDSL